MWVGGAEDYVLNDLGDPLQRKGASEVTCPPTPISPPQVFASLPPHLSQILAYILFPSIPSICPWLLGVKGSASDPLEAQ